MTHTEKSKAADVSIFFTNDLLLINVESSVGVESGRCIIFEQIRLITHI